MLPVGTLLMNGAYRIEKQIGSGGFGNTYEVRNLSFDEVYAMKEFFMKDINLRSDKNVTVSVPGNKTTFESQLKKFKKEAQRLRSLSNPHIVKVHDLFEENGTVYYVMDLIDGHTLSDIVKKDGPMSEEMAMNIFWQILEALDVVHNQNPMMLHLDIKPSNIMVDKSGNAYLLDFGSSKQVDSDHNMTSSAFTMTPGYAPSELIDKTANRIGPWTDLYELGATLYYLMTGQQPPTISEISEDGSDAFNFPKTVSGKTRELILWLMAISRAKRPKSVEEVYGVLGICPESVEDENNEVETDIDGEEEAVLGGSGNNVDGDETVLGNGGNGGDDTTEIIGPEPMPAPEPTITGSTSKNNNLLYAFLGLIAVGAVLFLIFGNNTSDTTADSFLEDTDSIAEVEDSVIDSVAVDRIDEYFYTDVSKIAQYIAEGNVDKLSYMIEYPIIRTYPLKDIKNGDEMAAYFNTLFDTNIRNKLRNATEKDWNHLGWRGYCFDNGSIWVNEEMKLYSVNHMSAKEKALYNQKVKEDLETLSSSLRDGGWKPYLCYMDTEDGSILRIDHVGEKYRLTVFRRGGSLHEPDLCLYGKRIIEGSMNNETDVFTDGKLSYEIDVSESVVDGNHYVSVEDKNTNKSWSHEIKKCYWLDLILSYQKDREQMSDQTIEAVETTIKGHVKDEAGECVIGAAIKVKGTANGTVTDFDGNFSLKCKIGAMLIITYPDLPPLELPAKESMEVTLTGKCY